jgi:hypothetical protein
MAKSTLSPADLEHIHQLAKRWGPIVVRHTWGEQGPGLDVTLDQMEQAALAALRGLLAGTLEAATQQQAQHLGNQQPCPDCGRPCPLHHEPRPMHTRGGPFEHREPLAHCPVCDRDFFPPEALPGSG